MLFCASSVESFAWLELGLWLSQVLGFYSYDFFHETLPMTSVIHKNHTCMILVTLSLFPFSRLTQEASRF